MYYSLTINGRANQTTNNRFGGSPQYRLDQVRYHSQYPF